VNSNLIKKLCIIPTLDLISLQKIKNCAIFYSSRDGHCSMNFLVGSLGHAGSIL